MMTAWLQVRQTDSVAAQDDDGDQPALCLGTTPVIQAWVKLHIFKYVYFSARAIVNRYFRQACKSAALSLSKQDK